MTPQHALPLAAALIATVTPLIVVAVVYAVAAGQTRASSPPLGWPPIARWLVWFTVVATAGTVAVTLVLPAGSFAPGAVGLAAFALLALPALRALGVIDAASRPSREVQATTRQAALTTRRPGDYLAWPWRLVAYVIAIGGLATFAWRAATPSAGREWWVPSGFALAAAAFLLLYEVWIHDVITGPSVGADHEATRRRMARRILGIEIALLIASIGAAHAVLDLDWTTQGIAGGAIVLAGALIAVFGCALALASGVSYRRYAPVTSS